MLIPEPRPRVSNMSWDGSWEVAFLTSSQVMLTLLAYGTTAVVLSKLS